MTADQTRATDRERAALERFVTLAAACVCRADDGCPHVTQTLRLADYLGARPYMSAEELRPEG
jgi:hypothetical protein